MENDGFNDHFLLVIFSVPAALLSGQKTEKTKRKGRGWGTSGWWLATATSSDSVSLSRPTLSPLPFLPFSLSPTLLPYTVRSNLTVMDDTRASTPQVPLKLHKLVPFQINFHSGPYNLKFLIFSKFQTFLL